MDKINIREKLGDGFLDIAKYIATVMILSMSFSSLEKPIFVWVAALVLAAALTSAIILYRQPKKTTSKNKRRK